MKFATKKTATKKTAKKKTAGADGHRGRVSAYAGKKIIKLVKTEDTGIRAEGKVRTCWDAIPNGKDGIKFETYREKTGMPGFSRKTLAEFIRSKYVKVVDAGKVKEATTAE